MRAFDGLLPKWNTWADKGVGSALARDFQPPLGRKRPSYAGFKASNDFGNNPFQGVP